MSLQAVEFESTHKLHKHLLRSDIMTLLAKTIKHPVAKDSNLSSRARTVCSSIHCHLLWSEAIILIMLTALPYRL